MWPDTDAWAFQTMVKRIVTALKERGYIVWVSTSALCETSEQSMNVNWPPLQLDVESMKGSVLDAMAEAIEAAEVMLCEWY